MRRHIYPRNKLFARLSGICFNTPTDSGGEPGGGGGESVDQGAPAPSLPNGGGQVQQNADHSSFNSPPSSAADSQNVREIMNRGDNATLSMDEIAALVRFDAPFKAPPAAAASVQPTEPVQPAAPAVPAAPEAPTISQDARAIIDALRQSQANVPPAPANTPPSAPDAPRPYYGGEIPAVRVSQEVLQGILGTNDPAILANASPAIDSLINGVLNRAYQDTNARMEAMARSLLTMMPQHVQTIQQTSDAEREFYTGFPELKSNELRPLVNQISSLYVTAMRKTNPGFAWTPETRAQCGELIHREFERRYGFKIPRTAQPTIGNVPAAPAQPTPAAPRLPFVPRGGARPPAANTPQHQSADVLSFVI